jgi:tetratricopeptide (TPR) repeat protein
MQGFRGHRSNARWLAARWIVAGWLAAAAMVGPAAAQSPSVDPALQAEIQSVFQQLYRDPGNAALTYRYAQLQSAAGNYEAAVAALERLLLVNPNQPVLQYELGALYFRMGSYETARTYLLQAQASSQTPPDVQQRIQAYLDDADRRTSRHQFTGSITVGPRYQTNANLATRNPTVQAAGVQIVSPDQAHQDVSGVILARLTHVYDFRTNDETAWVSNVLFYGSRYFSTPTSNLVLGELYTGPRFQFLPRWRRDATIRPYFITSIVGLDDTNYSHAFGAGLDLSLPFSSRWGLELSYQFRAINYNNIASQPTASILTGSENLIRGRVVFQATPDIAVLGELSGRFVGTRSSSFDFNEIGAVATYTQDYRVFARWFGPRPWNVTGSLYYYHRNYDAPDPVVNPTVSRREDEYRVALANVIPISESWFLVQQVDRWIVDSNLPNYQRRDWSLLGAVRWRF